MLYVNISEKTIVLYDTKGEKLTIKPNGRIDDSIAPIVINIESFLPYGMKRNPKRIKDLESGNR